MANDIIPVPKNPTRNPPERPIWLSGMNRGGTAALPAVSALVRASPRPTTIVAFDPVAGRAAAYAEAAKKRGVDVRPVTARFEDAVLEERQLPMLHDLHVDRAETIVAAIEHARAHAYPLSALLIVMAPGVGVLAYRLALAPGFERDYAQGSTLFGGFAAVSGREGSRAIFGRGAPAHGRIEARIRDWYAEHLANDVSSLAAGQPAPFAIEATDGRNTMPVVVLAADTLEPDADRVAMRVAEESPFPLHPNQPFHSVEIAQKPEPTLRFRIGYVRRNHVLQVGRPHDLGRSRVAEIARREVAEAQERTRRSTVDVLATAPAALARRTNTETSTVRVARSPASALGLALAMTALGLATQRSPIETTD